MPILSAFIWAICGSFPPGCCRIRHAPDRSRKLKHAARDRASFKHVARGGSGSAGEELDHVNFCNDPDDLLVFDDDGDVVGVEDLMDLGQGIAEGDLTL